MTTTAEKPWVSWGMFSSAMLLSGWLIFLSFNDKNDAKTDIALRQSQRRLQELQASSIKEIQSRLNYQEAKIQSIELLLKLRSSRANSDQTDSAVRRPASPAVSQPDDSARNSESSSVEDFRAMVLKSAKGKERESIANHYKKEDAFKASLDAAQKQKFDAEVKNAYDSFLEESEVDGDLLTDSQKSALRQSAETTVILEWMIGDHSVRKAEIKSVSQEQKQARKEKLRLLEEEFSKLDEESEQMLKESADE